MFTTIAKKKGIRNGDSDLISKEIPKRIETNPRYIGFRLNRKTPSWIRTLDTSNGFTVVLALLNARSAEILIQIPKNSGMSPIKFQGEGIM
jgi:hypothetical protein